MSRSVFLGRVVGKGEPEWLPDDVEAAIALDEYERDLHICGQPASQSMATKIDDRGRQVPAHQYEGEAWICYACVAVEEARESMSEHDHRQSIAYRVKRLD